MVTQNSNSITQASLAEARAGTYRLLSQLYSHELDREVLEFLRENPGIISNNFLTREQEESWLQALRVEYSYLFLLNIYPYESLYTGPEVRLNTVETERVQAFYEELGFNNNSEVFADHVAVELEFMATLAQQEAHYWQKNLKVQAGYLSGLAQKFLQEHLLKWLLIFSLAVQRTTRQAFYRELVEETLAFVCQDFQQLSEGLNEKEVAAIEQRSITAKPSHERSLSNLIRYLITPDEAGFYLCKIEMFRLAQAMQLPSGVGDRFQMLKSLFENAAQYEMLEKLVSALIEIVQGYEEDFDRLITEFEVARPGWQGWQERLKATQQLLEEVGQTLKMTES